MTKLGEVIVLDVGYCGDLKSCANMLVRGLGRVVEDEGELGLLGLNMLFVRGDV